LHLSQGVVHDTEEAVAPREGDGEGDSTSIFEQDRAKLASRGGGHSLYDQLQANQEAKDEEWQAAHPKNSTSLSDPVAFPPTTPLLISVFVCVFVCVGVGVELGRMYGT
jgi:hypothetical protein